jgi:hypothetical protein
VSKELAAEFLLSLCESRRPSLQLSDQQIAEVELAKREVREGKIATDTEMDEVWQRFGR